MMCLRDRPVVLGAVLPASQDGVEVKIEFGWVEIAQ